MNRINTGTERCACGAKPGEDHLPACRPADRLGRYILMGTSRLAVPCDDLLTWAKWMETYDRHVASETIGGSYWVSTVFLGLDHGFGSEMPILFETMVFTEHKVRHEFLGRMRDTRLSDIWQDRCGTWEEALDMHERGVSYARSLLRQLPVVIGEHNVISR